MDASKNLRIGALLIFGFIVCGSAAHAAIDPAMVTHDLETIYQTTTPQPLLSHIGSPLDKRVQPILIRQAGYLVSTLEPWTGKDGALSLSNFNSNEHSLRPNARTINGLAVMVRSLPDDAFPTTLTRAMCRDKAIAMLNFVLYTHGDGGLKCADGKQWKNQWQSAIWANSAGTGCWLLWDNITPEMKWLAATMITEEADRFVDVTPPAQIDNDTKAEENAWNATVITLAACMFPHHPHHDKWVKTAKLWGVSAFLRKADLESSDVVDGIKLSSSGLGPNLHDDYTLENHNRVHPDYMNTINMNLEQWMPWEWTGQSLPEAFTFNNKEVFATLKALTFPDAGYIYVNGQDWQLHRNCNWFSTYMLQSVLSNDSDAAMLARIALDVTEKMLARTADMGMFLPEEYQFPSAQMDALEMYAYVHLLLCSRGEGATPTPEAQYWKKDSGNKVYDAGKFAVARTDHSFASFSWGDQPMGMVMPLDKDLMIAPNERSMIGVVSAPGVKRETPRVIRSKVNSDDDGSSSQLSVRGELLRADDTMSQRFAFISLGNGRAVYVDDLRVLKAVKDVRINLGALSVLNDKRWVYHDGTRDLYWKSGNRTFDVNDGKPSNPLESNSPWYNIDDRMGIVVASSSGHQSYDDNKKIGNGRLEQLFQLNAFTTGPVSLEPSEKPITATVLVFYPGKNHDETAKLSQNVMANWTFPGLCQLTLDDNTVLKIDLVNLQVTRIDSKK